MTGADESNLTHRFELADEDRVAIETVLQRPLRYPVLDLPVRDEAGRPRVMLTYPLVEGKPFPTMAWLVDAALNRQISDLERCGQIRELKALIEQDEVLKLQVINDHRRYAAQRFRLLHPVDRLTVWRGSMRDVFFKTGVAGTHHASGLKCLHAHVAHALIGRDAIGERIMRELNEQ